MFCCVGDVCRVRWCCVCIVCIVCIVCVLYCGIYIERYKFIFVYYILYTCQSICDGPLSRCFSRVIEYTITIVILYIIKVNNNSNTY